MLTSTIVCSVAHWLSVLHIQWRTQKIFMGRGLFQRHMVVSCIWCELFVTSQFNFIPCFQTKVLAKFVYIIWYAYFFTSTPLILCRCTEYKLSAVQVRLLEKNKLNATTQQFITAKISGCVLKQGSETRSSLRQSNLQLQNQAALRSPQMRAVEHWRCAAELLAGAHPGLQDQILLKQIKYAGKCLFLWCIEVRRPVTRGMGRSPLRKICAPTGKMCWRYFETIAHSLKNFFPSLKTLRPLLVSQADYGPGSPANV